MMKKLSKIALLAAASAFMLAVFPACGDDDEDNDPPKATLALVGDPVVLKAGTPTAVEATVTVENDTFSTEAKAILPGGEIPKGKFELKATDAKVTVTAATLKEWTSDAVAKISFTATAAEDAEAGTGTISAEIKEGTLTSNASLTAEGKITYTVKNAGGGDGDDGGDGNQNQNQGGNDNQNQGGGGNQNQGGNGNQNQGGNEGDGEATEPSVKIYDQNEADITGKTDVAMKPEDVLNVQAIPNDFPDGDVDYEWVSDVVTVAKVEQDPTNKAQARITALAEGTAIITVKATSGETIKSADVTITVTAEEAGGEPSKAENYTLSIEDLAALGSIKGESKDFDTTVTKIWASADGKSIQGFSDGQPPFVKMTGGGVKVDAGAEYGLQVKTSGTATITITALSKQEKNASQWTLKGMEGASDVESTGTPAVASTELKSATLSQDTTPATLTFANVPAGTYMLGPKSDGGYLFSLVITYN